MSLRIHVPGQTSKGTPNSKQLSSSTTAAPRSSGLVSSGEPGHFPSEPQAPVANSQGSGGASSGGLARRSQDPNTPQSVDDPLRDLVCQREQLRQGAREVDNALRDIRRFNDQGASDALTALAWAATMMVLNITRHCLEAVYPEAKEQFRLQDKLFEEANKLLKVFGWKPVPTKKDILDNLQDKDARETAKRARQLREVRDQIKKFYKFKSPWAEDIDFLINLGTGMVEDFALLRDAMDRVMYPSNSAETNALRTRHHLQQRVREMDDRINKMIEEAQRRQRIA